MDSISVRRGEPDMSTTLSMPPELVRDAHIYAAAHGTTMSQMIRDYFAGIVQTSTSSDESPSARLHRLVDEFDFRSTDGWKFQREECYERGARP